MSPSVKHLALDGSLVEISSPAHSDLDFPASSIAVFSVDGVGREFTASHVGFGADVAEYYGMTLDESYSMQGGTLRLGATTQVWPELNDAGDHITRLLRLGVWEGVRYSVHAALVGGTSNDLVRLFSHFTIVETPRGITLEPVSSSVTRHVHEPSLLKEVEGIGLLDIVALTTSESQRLPRWRGTQVTGGELFTDQPETGARYYVLVSRTSRTLVLPGGDCDHSAVLAGLAHLRVDWQRQPA
jgi:hypothetical protein